MDLDGLKKAQSNFKNHTEEERKKAFTKLWIAIINKMIKSKN